MIRKTLATATFVACIVLSAMAAQASERSGSFFGVSGKSTSGGVTVSKDAEGYIVTLGSNFSFSGAPDPKIGFGSNGQFVNGTLVGLLQSNNGSQSFRVPAHIDVSQFNEVHLWCEQFSVGLGVAPIN